AARRGHAAPRRPRDRMARRTWLAAAEGGGVMAGELAQLLETWEPVIGLEVHVQLATHSKAFSPSGVQFGARPNSLTDPLVLGMPGTLPVFNRAALELALRLGVATESKIRARSRFARKH